MKEVAAYMMLVLGGSATPSAEDVTKVIEAAGGEADADKVTSLINDMEGKDFNELLEAGREKLKDVSMGGGGGGGGGGGAAAAGGDAAPAEAEKPAEEEVDALEGGMDMFGGGGGDY